MWSILMYFLIHFCPLFTLSYLIIISVGWDRYCPHFTTAAAAAKSLQSCPTLCTPIDGSPSGSPVPGILQARTLEWVANSFSDAWKWKVKVKSLSRVRLLATPWTAAYQALRPWDFPGKSTRVGCHCLLRILQLRTMRSSPNRSSRAELKYGILPHCFFLLQFKWLKSRENQC